MKKEHFIALLLPAVIALVMCQSAWAKDGKPIARVLDQGTGYDEHTFKSYGNEILFAEIKSDIYQTRGRKGGSHETGEETEGGCSVDHSAGGGTDAGSTGGCSGDDSGGATDEDHGGCSGGGGGGDICLQVIDPDGQKICWAGRPDYPGWQRDPRLACPLPEGYAERAFTIRVFKGQCGNPDMGAVTLPGETPVVYLLYYQILGAAD